MSQPQKSKISGLVITYNEEKNIEEVIHNLNFVDEIIVIDSFSTDKTIAIIEKYPNVKLIKNKFENFTFQRNLALSLANNPWILFIDADERITDALREEILLTVNNPKADDAYGFYRKFMFQKKPLYFSGWQTDKNIRLFRKGKAEYIREKLVHEKLSISGSQNTLKNKLIHYSYTDYHSYKGKMVNYGKLKAKELFLKKIKPNAFHLYIKPVYKFLHSYIIRLGILDGKKGIIICYLNALSIYVRYPELKKLNKENN
jgi:glycosyltransferase involved in cell wall biosynthesis